jgi:hypothetical protein
MGPIFYGVMLQTGDTNTDSERQENQAVSGKLESSRVRQAYRRLAGLFLQRQRQAVPPLGRAEDPVPNAGSKPESPADPCARRCGCR